MAATEYVLSDDMLRAFAERAGPTTARTASSRRTSTT